MRLFRNIIILLLIVCCGVTDAQEAGATRSRLQAYMEKYPQSQLRDVYKYCFQDYFGLEHLLSDSMSAVRYVEHEIANADTSDWSRPVFCYPSLNDNYVRVDLNYVRRGIITVSDLVSAMLESARKTEAITPMKVKEWEGEWRKIREALFDVYPLPRNFVEDSEMIDRLLSEGGYVMHHSAHFNKTYRQHYRIIRKDVFDQKILPMIVISE